jgi:hypothetical protein
MDMGTSLRVVLIVIWNHLELFFIKLVLLHKTGSMYFVALSRGLAETVGKIGRKALKNRAVIGFPRLRTGCQAMRLFNAV